MERGAYAVFWIERFCRLYEGEWGGSPLVLRGCHECGTYGLPSADEFDSWEDALPTFIERAERYAECVRAGHAIDWQFECFMRVYGWTVFSERWKRWVRRFKKGIIFVPKKNKKSPTLAANSLYLTAGDGEQGQKVYILAKDGNQARRAVGEHAVKMVEKSPELTEMLRVNRSTLRISYPASDSYMEPLSSSNEASQKSKEGLNGSTAVDEIHVVSRELMRRVSRAGISRSEPLDWEVSTAGNDPDGYGKERFDYAVGVQSGVIDDQECFAAIYAAPQDLSDADLDADPVKYGRMANPAWGHTVGEDEFLKDYERSKKKLSDLLDFKMYRLNIWQRAAHPWLQSGAWDRCYRAFVEDSLLGQDCCAGLDLSRTRDMTALVLAFLGDEEEEIRLLSYFWLPEERAKQISQQVSVLAWARNGFIELTPGDVIDYGFIRTRFRDLAKKFNIQVLAYDPRFAEETTQALEQGVTTATGETIEEGTGVERFAFTQNDANFAAPTEDFERLVISGKLHHNGHPVLSWQAGHVMVKMGWNKVKRVVKRKDDDVRTVDGIVAAIMALDRAKVVLGAGAAPSITII